MQLNKLAFTLIELLVVIAVIGILSGLIVVSMSGITDKATIAKSQIFSNSLRNALLSNIVSEWKFDEGSGTSLSDNWGSNTGTLINGTFTSSNCVYGSCLLLSGSSTYADFGSSSSLISTFDDGKSFTYGIWFYPTAWPSSFFWIVSKAFTSHTTPYYQIDLRLNNGTISSHVWRSDSFANYIPNISSILTLNNWYYATSSIDLANKTHSFYLNGKLINTTSVSTGTYTNHATSLTIGANKNIYTTTQYDFIGKIDDFKVFNSIITASQIKEQYYSGLNNLLSKGQITSDYYVSQISFK